MIEKKLIALIKHIIHKFLNLFGYEIHSIKRKPNTELYLSLYSKDSIDNKRFDNIGGGKFYHPCWATIDKATPCDLQYDILSLKPLPVKSNSTEIVYSGHTIEHINNEAAQNMFNEVYRILKPGGYFRIVTPNIELAYRAYRENDKHYFHWLDYYSKTWEKFGLNKPLNTASIEQIFLSRFAFSASTLCADGADERIDDNEFHRIYLSGYGQSFCPVLRDITYFDNKPKIALFVETIK